MHHLPRTFPEEGYAQLCADRSRLVVLKLLRLKIDAQESHAFVFSIRIDVHAPHLPGHLEGRRPDLNVRRLRGEVFDPHLSGLYAKKKLRVLRVTEKVIR